MDEDVVAGADSPQLEAQGFSEVSQVGKGHIGKCAARHPHEELAIVHAPHRSPSLG